MDGKRKGRRKSTRSGPVAQRAAMALDMGQACVIAACVGSGPNGLRDQRSLEGGSQETERAAIKSWNCLA